MASVTYTQYNTVLHKLHTRGFLILVLLRTGIWKQKQQNNTELTKLNAIAYCKTRNFRAPLILAFRAMKLFWRP